MSTNSKAEACENGGENAGVAGRPGTSHTPCSICLGEITDVCHADTCRHSFCYECLKRWSTIQPFCPLCKTKFNGIHHSLTEDGLYQVYQVPARSSNGAAGEPGSPFTSTAFRRAVYSENMWAEPLSDMTGRFRDVNAQFFRENPEQTIRVQEFVRREVFILLVHQRMEIGPSNYYYPFSTLIRFVTIVVSNTISIFDIMEAKMVDMLQTFFGSHTQHFCHELYNFANSPCDDVFDYDRNVRYPGRIIDLPNIEQMVRSYQRPLTMRALSDVETVVSDSYCDIVIVRTVSSPLEIIALDPFDLRFDVGTIVYGGTTSHPIETYEPRSAGQPSTSTGIRDSLEQPNNNPTSRRYSTRSMRSLDCSSSDDESTSDVQTARRSVRGRMKQRVETNKKENMK